MDKIEATEYSRGFFEFLGLNFEVMTETEKAIILVCFQGVAAKYTLAREALEEMIVKPTDRLSLEFSLVKMLKNECGVGSYTFNQLFQYVLRKYNAYAALWELHMEDLVCVYLHLFRLPYIEYSRIDPWIQEWRNAVRVPEALQKGVMPNVLH